MRIGSMLSAVANRTLTLSLILVVRWSSLVDNDMLLKVRIEAGEKTLKTLF